MNTEIDPPACSPLADLAAIKVAILYEDFACGTRARHFAGRLAESAAAIAPPSETLWRIDLLRSPIVASEAADAAADCDYLIVSLRGDHDLPAAARQWIEAHLHGAAARGAGLIVLSDSSLSRWRLLEGIRQYLRSACSVRGVPFFSHAAAPPPARTTSCIRDPSETATVEPALAHT